LGFNVDKAARLVTVDHSHNNYADTTVDGNPTERVFDGLRVSSILRRTKGKRSRDLPGDNSPMLYALKGIEGLQTDYRSLALLTRNGFAILDKFLAANADGWDCVIPMPSSHNIANILSKRVARRLPACQLEACALKKISAQNVREQLPGLSISSRDKTKLNGHIKRFARFNGWEADFQMKSITEPGLRNHVNPLALGRFLGRSPPRRILLVDDMVTSGSTLKHAEQIIAARYPMSSVEALTLLGTSK